MTLEDIFTAEELLLIDSGQYQPGREALDAKLDLISAMEREACAKECEHTAVRMGSEWMAHHCAAAIRARGQE